MFNSYVIQCKSAFIKHIVIFLDLMDTQGTCHGTFLPTTNQFSFLYLISHFILHPSHFLSLFRCRGYNKFFAACRFGNVHNLDKILDSNIFIGPEYKNRITDIEHHLPELCAEFDLVHEIIIQIYCTRFCNRDNDTFLARNIGCRSRGKLNFDTGLQHKR